MASKFFIDSKPRKKLIAGTAAIDTIMKALRPGSSNRLIPERFLHSPPTLDEKRLIQNCINFRFQKHVIPMPTLLQAMALYFFLSSTAFSVAYVETLKTVGSRSLPLMKWDFSCKKMFITYEIRSKLESNLVF